MTNWASLLQWFIAHVVTIELLLLLTELNTSIDALEQVNATVVDLLGLTQRLQTELNNITDQTVALNMSCRAAASNNSALTTFCNMIPNTSYNVIVDFSAVSTVFECVCMSVCVHVCLCVRLCASVCASVIY